MLWSNVTSNTGKYMQMQRGQVHLADANIVICKPERNSTSWHMKYKLTTATKYRTAHQVGSGFYGLLNPRYDTQH